MACIVQVGILGGSEFVAGAWPGSLGGMLREGHHLEHTRTVGWCTAAGLTCTHTQRDVSPAAAPHPAVCVCAHAQLSHQLAFTQQNVPTTLLAARLP